MIEIINEMKKSKSNQYSLFDLNSDIMKLTTYIDDSYNHGKLIIACKLIQYAARYMKSNDMLDELLAAYDLISTKESDFEIVCEFVKIYKQKYSSKSLSELREIKRSFEFAFDVCKDMTIKSELDIINFSIELKLRYDKGNTTFR